MKKNYKPLAFLLLLFGLVFVIGGTIAYYSSSDDFENTFATSSYTMEVQETFESPSNWTPGTTTPKEVIATNRGETLAAVRVKLTPSWKDSEDHNLPLTDSNNNDDSSIKLEISPCLIWIAFKNVSASIFNNCIMIII